jgi:hypothetical protein
VHRPKVLCLARRFEARHVAFTLVRRLMRDFGAVVHTLPLAVRTAGDEFATSRPIDSQAICHDRARHVRQPFQETVGVPYQEE